MRAVRPIRKTRKTPARQIAVARELAEEFKRNQLVLAERNRSVSLAESELADLSPVPLALLSRRGVIVSASKPLFELFEAPAEEVLFHSIPAFLRPEDVVPFFKFLNDCRKKGRTQRAEFVMDVNHRSSKHVLLIVSPREADDPERTVFRAAFVELTENEQRVSDPRIPQQDTRLMEVIDGIVWEAEYPMCFTFVSRQAERILGFPATNWVLDPDFWAKHIYHEDRDRVLQARAQAVKKLSHHVLHYRMVTSARSVIHVKDSAVIVAGAPGWTRISGIITDVTDLDRAREDLNQANENLEASITERTSKMQQSLEAMETLCYGIAHDLKAPVRGLEGFVGILIADYHDVFDKEARNYAHRCRLALARMNELIDAILTYGRLNHTVPELIPLDARHTIDRVLASLEPEITESNAKIDIQLTIPRVCANPYLLEQVFTNLIANALKFVKPGTHPEISISAVQVDVRHGFEAGPCVEARHGIDGGRQVDAGRGDEVGRGAGRAVACEQRPVPSEPAVQPPSSHVTHVTDATRLTHASHVTDLTHLTSTAKNPPSHSSAAEFVRITVTDNGIGMPSHAITRMFGMFQKFHRPEEYAGTGIGLAVVKRAVQLMNGRVGVFSEPNQGSSFWIELPFAP